MPLPFADLNLYPFAVVNHNREYNSFSEFCQYLSQIEPESGRGELQHKMPKM